MKKIALLGSTGSVGTQAADIVRRNPGSLRVTALAACRNVSAAEQQVREFLPSLVCMYDEDAARDLRTRTADLPVRITAGMDGLLELAADPGNDFFFNSVSGMIGIRPTLAAIAAGKKIALANKETLVAAGHLIMPAAKEAGITILPVDSEHSAIFQCLNGEPRGRIRKILLTCSGGIFRGKKREELLHVTAEEALVNPNWDMGGKVTVDTATLVNKGLEIIEATHLFDVPADRIEVLVHPKSLCHSGVEFTDGAQILQTAVPDMRLPIQYAFFYPDRVPGPVEPLSLADRGPLVFERPDTETFRGIPLARRAAECGGTMPTVFNAADEEAVALFLAGRTGFLEICELIGEAMARHRAVPSPDLDEILAAEAEARETVRALSR